MSNANTELQVLEISKANHKTSIVVNTYRPPSGNQQDFLTDINSTMHEIAKSHYSDIYLLGDTNLDHTPVKKSEITNALENNMKAYRCKQCISSSTRKTASTSILIDTIYIKTAKKVKSFLLKTTVSDHYLVRCVRYLDYHAPEGFTFRGRSYKNIIMKRVKSSTAIMTGSSYTLWVMSIWYGNSFSH